MKTTKLGLSLITISMLAGTLASAQNLGQLINKTSVNGYLQFEGYGDSDKSYKRMYKTKGRLKFLLPVDSNNKIVYGLDTYGVVYNNNNNKNIDNRVDNTLLYLNGKLGNLAYNVGKIEVSTPVTGTGVGEAHGIGAIGALQYSTGGYNSNGTLSIIGGFVDNIKDLDQVPTTETSNNISTAAVVFNNSVNNFQLWYFHVNYMINHEYVLNYKLNMIPNEDTGKFVTELTYAKSDLTDSFKKTAGVSSNTQKYFNIDVNYELNNVFGKIGYAKTYSGGGIVTLDHDSPVAKVLPTEQVTGITNTSDHTVSYFSVGYKYNNVKTNIAYSNVDDKTSNDYNQQEYLIETNYKYTKNLDFKIYYSYLKQDHKNDNKEIYLGAKYKF